MSLKKRKPQGNSGRGKRTTPLGGGRPPMPKGSKYLGRVGAYHYIESETGTIYRGLGETEADYRFEATHMTPSLKNLIQAPAKMPKAAPTIKAVRPRKTPHMQKAKSLEEESKGKPAQEVVKVTGVFAQAEAAYKAHAEKVAAEEKVAQTLPRGAAFRSVRGKETALKEAKKLRILGWKIRVKQDPDAGPDMWALVNLGLSAKTKKRRESHDYPAQREAIKKHIAAQGTGPVSLRTPLRMGERQQAKEVESHRDRVSLWMERLRNAKSIAEIDDDLKTLRALRLDKKATPRLASGDFEQIEKFARARMDAIVEMKAKQEAAQEKTYSAYRRQLAKARTHDAVDAIIAEAKANGLSGTYLGDLENNAIARGQEISVEREEKVREASERAQRRRAEQKVKHSKAQTQAIERKKELAKDEEIQRENKIRDIKGQIQRAESEGEINEILTRVSQDIGTRGFPQMRAEDRDALEEYAKPRKIELRGDLAVEKYRIKLYAAKSEGEIADIMSQARQEKLPATVMQRIRLQEDAASFQLRRSFEQDQRARSAGQQVDDTIAKVEKYKSRIRVARTPEEVKAILLQAEDEGKWRPGGYQTISGTHITSIRDAAKNKLAALKGKETAPAPSPSATMDKLMRIRGDMEVAKTQDELDSLLHEAEKIKATWTDNKGTFYENTNRELVDEIQHMATDRRKYVSQAQYLDTPMSSLPTTQGFIRELTGIGKGVSKIKTVKQLDAALEEEAGSYGKGEVAYSSGKGTILDSTKAAAVVAPWGSGVDVGMNDPARGYKEVAPFSEDRVPILPFESSSIQMVAEDGSMGAIISGNYLEAILKATKGQNMKWWTSPNRPLVGENMDTHEKIYLAPRVVRDKEKETPSNFPRHNAMNQIMNTDAFYTRHGMVLRLPDDRGLKFGKNSWSLIDDYDKERTKNATMSLEHFDALGEERMWYLAFELVTRDLTRSGSSASYETDLCLGNLGYLAKENEASRVSMQDITHTIEMRVHKRNWAHEPETPIGKSITYENFKEASPEVFGRVKKKMVLLPVTIGGKVSVISYNPNLFKAVKALTGPNAQLSLQGPQGKVLVAENPSTGVQIRLAGWSREKS